MRWCRKLWSLCPCKSLQNCGMMSKVVEIIISFQCIIEKFWRQISLQVGQEVVRPVLVAPVLLFLCSNTHICVSSHSKLRLAIIIVSRGLNLIFARKKSHRLSFRVEILPLLTQNMQVALKIQRVRRRKLEFWWLRLQIKFRKTRPHGN